MPMLNDTVTSQLFVRVCTRLMRYIVASEPFSSQVTCINEPPEVPKIFLSMTPVRSFPWWMRTVPSDQFKVSAPFFGNLFPLPLKFSLGMIRENTCFPVHKGLGFKIAGGGITPSQSSPTHISRLKSKSCSMKVSRLVIRAEANKESCTMPMTGLLDCGDTMFLGTIMICSSSALAATDCGTCRFISSPSKSALYGDVTDRFRRNVEWSSTLTRCAMIDILCNEGCRLNTMRSSSLRCLSTTNPVCNARSFRCLTKRRSTRRPSAWTTYRAPGQTSGPFLTRAESSWTLYGATRSGTVNVFAMLLGTPTWSTDRLGSAVMTVLAEKSTRLPIRLPLIRPSLPLRRCRMVLRGFPPRCFSCTPSLALASLSNNALTLYWSNSSNWETMWGASPARHSCSSVLLAFTILTN
mmetsp:Transcript_25098/g.65226  ORF Transcript_25098/g.65226 Transcript_25098/m.65226 type:complete len:409 (+) Transcript_25098:3019-4245(+)